MSKITIFTGSGASFGCSDVNPNSPPLGRDLYAELEKFDPVFMSKVNSIVGQDNTENFEVKMHEIWNAKINLVLFNSLLAVYFSQFVPINHSNTYVRLLSLIKENNFDCVYSTLNYDCIAEYAAQAINWKINYNFKNYNKDEFNILKLHGSCNFVMSGMTGPLGGMSMPSQPGVLEGPMAALWPPANMRTEIQRHPSGPIMAFYMKDKPTQVNSRTLKEIQSVWQERINETDKLLIIGINSNPEDSHIWNVIKNTRTKIGFVGSDRGFKKLKKLKLKTIPNHLAEQFADSIPEIESFIF